MPELDYAFLADFAQVENGRLTSVGASYTHVTVPDLNTGWITAIAGRVKTTVDAPPVALRIEVGPASGAFRFNFDSQLRPGVDVRPYDGGKVGILFSALMTLPLITEGLYVAKIHLDEALVRTLAFEVEVEGETRPI